MFTGTLAMLHRAIRLDARLTRTHLFRLAFALLVYCALIYLQIISASLLGGRYTPKSTSATGGK